MGLNGIKDIETPFKTHSMGECYRMFMYIPGPTSTASIAQATGEGPRDPRGRAAARRLGARRGCGARGALRGTLGGGADVESQGWRLGRIFQGFQGE